MSHSVPHKSLRLEDVHSIHAFEFANEAERLSASPAAGDVGKLALQTDDWTYWSLKSVLPTVWKPAGGGLSGPVSIEGRAQGDLEKVLVQFPIFDDTLTAPGVETRAGMAITQLPGGSVAHFHVRGSDPNSGAPLSEVQVDAWDGQCEVDAKCLIPAQASDARLMAEPDLGAVTVESVAGRATLRAQVGVGVVLDMTSPDTNSHQLTFLNGGGVTADTLPLARKVAVPASATSPGLLGDFACDGSFAYFCIATDTWVRCAVATW